MKALIHLDEQHRFELRLHTEGRNDITLLHLLEKQYPAIVREGYDQALVPIQARGSIEKQLSNKRSLAISYEPGGPDGFGRSFVWDGAPIQAAAVHVHQPEQWSMYEVKINGRDVDPAKFDLFPGDLLRVSPQRIMADASLFEATVRSASTATPQPKRDPKLLALLNAARSLCHWASFNSPSMVADARADLEKVALAWGSRQCDVCGRRGDHEWEELREEQRAAHEAEMTAQL